MIKRISEISPASRGRNLVDFLNKEFLIKKIQIEERQMADGKITKVANLIIEVDNKEFEVYTFAQIVVKQLERLLPNQLPVLATLKKEKRYYILE